jgi:hypothetical protein
MKVRTVTRALLPPFVVLLLSNSLARDATFFGPFLAASAAVLAFSFDSGIFRLGQSRRGPLAAIGLACLGTFLALAGPCTAQQRLPWQPILAILAVTAVVTLANAAIERRDPEAGRSRDWTAWRFLLSFVAAGAVLGLQALGTIPLWSPGSGP